MCGIAINYGFHAINELNKEEEKGYSPVRGDHSVYHKG